MNNPRALNFAANLKWLFNELPFMDRFKAAADAGFDAVEYASPYDFKAELLRDALRDQGLTQVLINTPTGEAASPGSNGYCCTPGSQSVFRRGVEDALTYASELDCRLIHLMAGKIPEAVFDAHATDVFRENLAWAIDAATGSGTTFVLEFINQIDVPRYFLRSLNQASDLLRKVGGTKVGLLFDVYHCQMSGDVNNEFAKFRPQIADIIQFADVPGRHEPVTGTLPWLALADRILSSDYDGWIGCEYRPRDSTAGGLRWIERFNKGLSLC